MVAKPRAKIMTFHPLSLPTLLFLPRLLLPLLLPLTSARLVLSFPHDLFPMFSLITMLVTILSVQYRLSLGDHQSLWPGKDAYRTGGIEWNEFPFSLILYTPCAMWKHASSLNFVSVEEVRQLSCCSLAFSSCHSKVYHGPMFASSFIESAGMGVTGSFWGHRRSRHWISSSHVAPLATSLTLIKLLGATHGFDFLRLWKVLRATGQRGMAVTVLALRSCRRRSRFVRRGATQRILARFLNSIPETLPQMPKKHAAKDGESPATRRAKSERLSGILSLSLFLERGRVSIETHAFFHLTKKAVFRPVVSRSAMSNKWIRESDDLL